MTASAGNYGNLIFPAKYSEVMAVGASTIHYQIADYSAASGVEVFAPEANFTVTRFTAPT